MWVLCVFCSGKVVCTGGLKHAVSLCCDQPIWSSVVDNLWDCCLCCFNMWGLPGYAGPAGAEACWASCCWGWQNAMLPYLPWGNGLWAAFKKWCRRGYCWLRLHKVLTQFAEEDTHLKWCALHGWEITYVFSLWEPGAQPGIALWSWSTIPCCGNCYNRWEKAIFKFLLSMPLGHIYLATCSSRSWLEKMPGPARCFPCNAFFLNLLFRVYICSLFAVVIHRA